MSQQYGYAGQPPYQQGYMPQSNNPFPTQGQHAPIFMPPPHMHAGSESAMESGTTENKTDFSFDSQTIRAAFIRKVFSLVSLMLFVVTIMTAVPFLSPETKHFVQRTPSLYFISYAVFLVVYLTLMCCESVRRSSPANLIGLGILTLSIGYMTMMICSMYNIQSVLLTLIITVVCCGGIIIFSMQSKHDLTSMMGVMFILSMVLFVFGIVALIAALVFKVQWLYTVYAGLAALLFMFYLAIDVQMLVGGKKHELSPEDYIFAAIQIFMDIVYIFWMLLTLFGSNNN